MAFTRAQANDLLNKAEMRLYDDSRANGLRGLDRAALAGRVERARTARDRARDLLKRQRLAARKRGEGRDEGIAARTARKEALLVEILQRFVDARRAAPVGASRATAAKPAATQAASRAVATGKAAARKRATKKVAVRKAPAKKTSGAKSPATKRPATKTATGARVTGNGAARQAAAGMESTEGAAANRAASTKAAATTTTTKKVATKKVATRKAATRKRAAGTTGRKAASRDTLSPQRALENTRRLLEAKQERDRTPQPWQSLDPVTDHVPQPGFQSPQAADKAQQLHAGESRMAPIHGSMSTHDRRNQGKRDHRGDDGSGTGP